MYEKRFDLLNLIVSFSLNFLNILGDPFIFQKHHLIFRQLSFPLPKKVFLIIFDFLSHNYILLYLRNLYYYEIYLIIVAIDLVEAFLIDFLDMEVIIHQLFSIL